MLAMGAGGISVALAMAGVPYYLKTPEVWGIYLEGEFPPFVSGKDLILKLLGDYSCKAGVGKVMEFYGPGVSSLSMASRSTIANMSVDMGFTGCVFPSDEVTKQFLDVNSREDQFMELKTEPDALFSETLKIDLKTIEPMVACPSNPDNVKTARELSDVKVNQVIIGSSCNGSYDDFMIAAKMLEGKIKHPTVSFEINPGSRQALENILINGGLKTLIEAGARVHEPGCLGCIGMGQSPATGTNSLRTFPRNFKGRSGTKDDAVYLCSPETAAVSAITGKITDPRTFMENKVSITAPDKYVFKDEWFLAPSFNPEKVNIIKGPNIKPFPVINALPESIEKEVVIKVGDNISTDIIMPAGNRVLPFRSNIPKISEFVFDVIDEGFFKRVKEKDGGIVIGGDNYGQGSSREHAALAPRYLGIAAKIVKSFARIHKANLINFGILPLTFKDPGDYDNIILGDKIVISDIRKMLEGGGGQIDVFVNGDKIVTNNDVSERHRQILLAGGILNYTKNTLS